GVREHFQREFHVLSRFQHRHAVAFYGADLNHPQGPFLVLEYVPGLNLEELLQRRGPLHPERASRLLVPLCSVLQALHDAGIVHRHLKPANIKVRFPFRSHETVKLLDFGLAKLTAMLYLAPEDVHNGAGITAIGTPEYICPEQARDADMDHRGDL